jgi:4-diphosphocytidyl-2-C-methyl-D-erythritol kinase
VVVRARAKVNLGLEVLGRRPDGYHELRSLLWAIDLADRVTLEAAEGGLMLTCDAPDVPATGDNLAWRAAELVCRASGRTGVRIRLAKAIPVAAGLGGGSADAAAVLVGLRHLWGLGMAPERLRALAIRLGMDVPFFLGRGPAFATGRGERLREVAGARPVPLVVVNPGLPLATRAVYGSLRPGDFTSGARVRALARAVAGGPAALAPLLVNGLERAAARLWPGLGEVKARLVEAGCLASVMSGSGSTVVGLAPSLAAARRVRDALAGGPGWRAWAGPAVVGPALSIARGARGR